MKSMESMENMIVMNRGHVQPSIGWYHNGQKDAIDIENISDFPIKLDGIGVLVGNQGADVGVSIYKHKEKETSVYETRRINAKEKIEEIIPFLFKSFKILSQERITIMLHQTNIGDRVQSCMVKSGKGTIEQDEILIKFFKSDKDDNGTSVSSGAIPTLYFTIDNDESCYCKRNFENYQSKNILNEMMPFISKKFNIDLNGLGVIEPIINEYNRYSFKKECKKCNKELLKLDQITCNGSRYINHKSSWATEKCQDRRCYECDEERQYKILKYSYYSKREIDDIDLYDGGIFYEKEIIYEEKRYVKVVINTQKQQIIVYCVERYMILKVFIIKNVKNVNWFGYVEIVCQKIL